LDASTGALMVLPGSPSNFTKKVGHQLQSQTRFEKRRDLINPGIPELSSDGSLRRRGGHLKENGENPPG
jgi:hypothetical protein